MKKTIALLLLMIAALTTQAQVIHWLTFIDTTDKNVGKIDQNGREVLYNHFINTVNAAVAEKGYKADVQDYYGTEMNPYNCKRAVENLKCSPGDIVVFYYIGHGTHGTNEKNPYPQMLLGTVDDKLFIPVQWVHDQLKSKGAALTVTIGMCCNVHQGATAKDGPMFSVNYGNAYLTDTELSAIQHLFLESRGDIILSSASPGQSSVACSSPWGPIDMFSACLIDNFETGASEGELSWTTLLSDVKDMINTISEGTQTPIYECNIGSKSAPTAQQRRMPEEQTLPDSQQDNLNLLGEVFDLLIDQRVSENQRIAYADKVLQLFTPDAVVRVLGQDGTVIDKRDALSFIARIATSRILLKVVPVDVNVGQQGIVELKVKEYYKKRK